MSYRIDKYLWCVRLCKTRSQASELVSKGKVRLNEQDVKPAREVKTGDVIQIQKHNAWFSFKIIALLERRVGAALINQYLEDLTPQEEVDKYKQYQLAQSAYRSYGTGKPSKKDRRDLDDFLDW